MPSLTRPASDSGRPRRAWRAGLRRSVRLLAEFRHEQRDAPRFYGVLARDTAEQVLSYVALDGAVLLDVGAGPGYFRQAFEAAGARYVGLDVEGTPGGSHGSQGGVDVLGSGLALPVRSGAVDVCCSFNVLEHVADPWGLADELVRVARPGGVVVLSYTTWWGPWGGHETAPWHYLGGDRARRRYRRRHGQEPKNRFGESLFALTVGDGLRWAREQQRRGLEVVDVTPRYNPRAVRALVRVPVLREVLTWNLIIVVRRP